VTRFITATADWLAAFAIRGRGTAAAYVNRQCNQCDQYRRQLWVQYCDISGCGGWYSSGCGSC
jgi:hypothetical protein